MSKTQTRLTSALATLSAALCVLALPVRASAQVAGVTDAPFSFKNDSNSNLTLELVSVVRRDGQEVPYNITWTVKPGQYSWLMHNNKKISGVVCTFVVRTPSLYLPGPGEPPYETVSGWDWYSSGPTEHGDVCIDFTEDWLKAHLKYPQHPMTPKFTPAIDSAPDRHRGFLKYQIGRVKGAIRQDEQLLVSQKQRVELANGTVEVFGWLLENSPNETDRGAAGSFKAGGRVRCGWANSS